MMQSDLMSRPKELKPEVEEANFFQRMLVHPMMLKSAKFIQNVGACCSALGIVIGALLLLNFAGLVTVSMSPFISAAYSLIWPLLLGAVGLDLLGKFLEKMCEQEQESMRGVLSGTDEIEEALTDNLNQFGPNVSPALAHISQLEVRQVPVNAEVMVSPPVFSLTSAQAEKVPHIQESSQSVRNR